MRKQGHFLRQHLEDLGRRLEDMGAIKVQTPLGWYWDLKPDLKPQESVTL